MEYVQAVNSYDQANAIRNGLIERGVPDGAISIVIKANSNGTPLHDNIGETLDDLSIQIDDAPSGTVSAFGVTFSVLTGLGAGALLLAIGPVAALAGGAALAAGGIAAVLTGLGVPEEEHDAYEHLLNNGDVLIAVDQHYARKLQQQMAA